MKSLNRRSLKGLALERRPKFKVPPWLEAERYFKRYRDTKKVIPLRPTKADTTPTAPYYPQLTVIDDFGPFDWNKALGKAHT